MANALIFGEKFGGVVAAETLAKQFALEYQITLASRRPRFVFYPAPAHLKKGRKRVFGKKTNSLRRQ